eukprot:TCALIF_11114-PA protein Name:"Protein of unknown function" AED:0.09 eAED:0.09 QI:83/1/0.6/1/0.5/0.6/5/0/159
MYTILIQIKADECSSRGGTSAGICAQGYGVCCTFTVACGATISQNCTYLVQEATTNPSTNPCTFTICKQSSDICRIRLDFTTFSIAGPAVGTTSAGDPIPEGKGGSIGDCNVDSFSVTAPGYKSSPVVCGFNSGQHSKRLSGLSFQNRSSVLPFYGKMR